MSYEIKTEYLEEGDVILFADLEDTITRIGAVDGVARRIDVIRNGPGIKDADAWFYTGVEAEHTVRRTRG